MSGPQLVTGPLLRRLLPVLLALGLIGYWFSTVEDDPRWWLRNWLPLVFTALLAGLALQRGAGRFAGSGWRWPLGVAGFAIPTIGLSTYLHYAYSVNLDNLFADGAGDLFRYLPVYTTGAGCIGFAIGWIVGRNVR